MIFPKGFLPLVYVCGKELEQLRLEFKRRRRVTEILLTYLVYPFGWIVMRVRDRMRGRDHSQTSVREFVVYTAEVEVEETRKRMIVNGGS